MGRGGWGRAAGGEGKGKGQHDREGSETLGKGREGLAMAASVWMWEVG